jgi:hypothetical protein
MGAARARGDIEAFVRGGKQTELAGGFDLVGWVELLRNPSANMPSAPPRDGFREGLNPSYDPRPGHQRPVFGIDTHGSRGGCAPPFCNSSIECRSGDRTKAMTPSRGGRLMVTPACMSRSQVA